MFQLLEQFIQLITRRYKIQLALFRQRFNYIVFTSLD